MTTDQILLLIVAALSPIGLLVSQIISASSARKSAYEAADRQERQAVEAGEHASVSEATSEKRRVFIEYLGLATQIFEVQRMYARKIRLSQIVDFKEYLAKRDELHAIEQQIVLFYPEMVDPLTRLREAINDAPEPGSVTLTPGSEQGVNKAIASVRDAMRDSLRVASIVVRD